MKASLSLCCLLLCLACGKKEEPPADEPGVAPTGLEAAEAKPEPTPAETVEVPSETALPVPEDFEDESAKAIDEKNYKAELAALEKEINADVETP